MRFISVLAVLVLSVALPGCAGNMDLVKGGTAASTSDKSIILLAVKISNQYKPGYQPNLQTARFYNKPGYKPEFFKTMTDGTKPEIVSIKQGLFKSEKDQYNDYLLSFSLSPGIYTLSDILGSYSIPLILDAPCYFILNATIDVKPNSVTYIGRVNATIKERTNDQEEPAGPVTPLIDQAIVGFHSGTFVLNVEDRYDEDIRNYRNEYPALKTVQIEKAILSIGQRAEAAVTTK